MIRDTLVIALEASWEQDPVRMEGKLWDVVDAYNMKLPTKGKKVTNAFKLPENSAKH